ncbi:MAG: SDR family NAD(P)-dependent oxidoreductase [Caulobacteraceae bacterium]
MGRLQGKIALVTGAASGIGRAIAIALAREGAGVMATDIDESAADVVARTIRDSGGRASASRLDVTDEDQWSAAVEQAELESGGLQILVNNAALCMLSPVGEMSLADWRRQTSVNLDGVFLGVRAALPLMARSGGGAIVNISSVAGLRGIAGLSGYCATKGAVRLFTKAVALECAQAWTGIRVNSIHPGSIETPIWVKMHHGGTLPDIGASETETIMAETRAAGVAATPTGSAGMPEDIAAGVIYLASDDARFVTGAELVIDGGVMAG